MGHLRLGEIPKTYPWVKVVALLDDAPADHAQVAHATAAAAAQRLRELGADPSLTYCFWLLTRLTWAARTEDFAGEVARLGIDAPPTASTLEFVAGVSDAAREELQQHPESGPFAEIASLAMRRTLTETVAQQNQSLFGSSVSDLQAAWQRYSTRVQFGRLARKFFGDFLSRTLRFYLDKELSNHVGPERELRSVDDAAEFMHAVDTHARDSARMLEQFAGDWYSKHNWEAAGAIRREEARYFVAHRRP